MHTSAVTLISSIGLFLFGATALSAQASTQCRKPGNLVVNGGFEGGPTLPGSFPREWAFDSFAKTAVPLWDDSEAHSGHRSAKITSQTRDDAFWTQDVAVRQNVPYFLAGWIKTRRVAHSGDLVDLGANISLFEAFESSPGVFGTQDWTRRGLLFTTESETQVRVAARLGFFAGITTGTAWFDDVTLRRVFPLEPHPRWRILVLIYRRTDITHTDVSGVRHRYVAQMTQPEAEQAATAARQFVTQDIPALSSGNLLPRVTIRFPTRTLTQLSPNADGWWPSPEDTAQERDPAFDSVIVIWDPRATDKTTGQPVWIGSAAGLTPAMGTGQAYTTLIIEAAITYGHRNVFKHEWGHSILEFFAAMGTSPTPKVENHTEAGQYVHCGTGTQYVWVDESEANPIPNSIYNNHSGFTHDYYSGTVALATQPKRCIGIIPSAWALGGPVSHSGNNALFTSSQRIRAIVVQVNALVASGLLDERYRNWLHRELELAAWADAKGLEHVAQVSLRRFVSNVNWLARNGKLGRHVAELLRRAANDATACL